MGNALIAFIWFGVSWFMQPNVYYMTLIIHYEPEEINEDQLKNRLNALEGVKDFNFSTSERVIYLRVDSQTYRPGSANALL